MYLDLRAGAMMAEAKPAANCATNANQNQAHNAKTKCRRTTKTR